MRKWISLVLTLALLLPLLSVMGMKAQAAEEDELRQTITEQYDAYAASIKQNNAHNLAVQQMLNHSLNHPGQYLEMDESAPFTASLFQSHLFREYFIQTAYAAVEVMREDQENRLLIGGAFVGWHDFALEYGARVYPYTDSELPDGNVGYYYEVIPNTVYNGSPNQHDKAMMLVVGSGRGWIKLTSTSADAQNITYRVEVILNDDFEFTGEYDKAAADGFDTSTSMLITLMGKLFLNEFSWSATVSFDLTVPNLCSHDTKSENYRWEANGMDVYAVSGEGLTENPLIRINERVKESESNSYSERIYFKTENMIRLRHDMPWVVEYRMSGRATFMMSRGINGLDITPFLALRGFYVSGGHYALTPVNPAKGMYRYGWDIYGINLNEQGFLASNTYTFRLENRIAEDDTNMVYLLVDGKELGPLNNFYHREIVDKGDFVDMKTTDDWFNGTDFNLNYLFNSWLSYYKGVNVEYIQIWENGEGAQPYLYYEDSTTAPTCTEPGGILRNCLFCGASFMEKVTEQALGHSWNEGVVTTAPTCTTEGVMTYTCANDPSHTRTEVIPAKGHAPVTDAAVDATCTADGLTEGSHCETCGEVLTAQETVPALGHVWDEGSEVTKPTVNAPGTIMYTCTVCGELRSEEVPYESHVSRLAGEHRYETAFKAADQMKENLGIKKFDAVVVASGTNFADALSGSYLAAVKEAPILLACDVEWVNDLVKDYIYQNLNEDGTIYILGGEGAVPASFEEGLDDFEIERLAGGNRFETNLLVLEEAGVGDKPILVCTGLEFADSLSASATKLPILLVYGDKLLPDQAAFLKANQGRDLYIIGGEGAVSNKLENALTTYGDIERVAGNNRFETSTLIAEKFFTTPESVVLAYAWDFPDGLCGGPLATTMNAPLILTMEKYEAKAAEYIQANAISNAIILGGETLIPDPSVNILFP